MSEAALKRSIKAALEAAGYVVYPQPATPLGVAGRPDFIVCAQGRFVGLEIKTVTGRLTRLQEHQLRRINAASGVGRVVRSVPEALAACQQGASERS